MPYINTLTGSYPLSREEVRSIWVDRRMDSDGVTNQNKRYIYESQLTSAFSADSEFAWVFPVPNAVDARKEIAKELTPKVSGDGNYYQSWDYQPLTSWETKKNFETYISNLVDDLNVSVIDSADGEVLSFSSDDESREFLARALLILPHAHATLEVVLGDNTTKTIQKSVIEDAIQKMVVETASIRVRERFYDPTTNGFVCVEDSTLSNVALRSTVTITSNSVTWDDSSNTMTFTTAGNNLTSSDVESLVDSDFTLFIEYKPQSNDNRTIFHLASDTTGSPSYSQPLVNVIDGQVYAGVNGTTASITSDSDAISADSSDTFCIGLSFEKYHQKLELTVDGVRHGTAFGASPAISGTTLLLVGGANDNTTSNFGWSATDNDLQGHVLKIKAWDKALSPSDLKRVKSNSSY